ncbi:MAG: helix-turn-helix transcriptional regulator [Bacteroidota bacterium]
MNSLTPGLIRQARKQRGYSQEALAEASGLSLRTIQRIEKGQVQPRPYSLKVLTDLLDLEPADLVVKEKTGSIDWPLLKQLNFVILLTVMLPIISLLLPWWQIKRKSANTVTRALGKKLISLQLVLLLGLFLAWCLRPLISMLLSGAVANGNFPYEILTYALFVLLNLGVALLNARQFQRHKTQFITLFPSLL